MLLWTSAILLMELMPIYQDSNGFMSFQTVVNIKRDLFTESNLERRDSNQFATAISGEGQMIYAF